jgi:hypothetical protein
MLAYRNFLSFAAKFNDLKQQIYTPVCTEATWFG